MSVVRQVQLPYHRPASASREGKGREGEEERLTTVEVLPCHSID